VSRNHGGDAVSLQGYSNTITGLLAEDLGCKGVVISCGAREGLVPGNCVVSGSTVRRYAQFSRTYQAGLAWSGVKNLFADNVFSDAPHTGILGMGNDNVFSGNTLRNLCYEGVHVQSARDSVL
jgi:hypothetical protein